MRRWRTLLSLLALLAWKVSAAEVQLVRPTPSSDPNMSRRSLRSLALAAYTWTDEKIGKEEQRLMCA